MFNLTRTNRPKNANKQNILNLKDLYGMNIFIKCILSQIKNNLLVNRYKDDFFYFFLLIFCFIFQSKDFILISISLKCIVLQI